MKTIQVYEYNARELDELLEEYEGKLIGYPDAVGFLIRSYKVNKLHGYIPDTGMGGSDEE